jgi:hypothetical protein
LNSSICGRNGYFTNELAEVLILAKRGEPHIGRTQKYDIQYFDDESHHPKNIAMSRDGSIEMGGWTVRIYKDVLKNTKKNNPEKSIFTRTPAFQSSHCKSELFFFCQYLKIKDDEIKLFLFLRE